jgi:G:T-mismatch repair DNA endonuclease (very short patch repair protein)
MQVPEFKRKMFQSLAENHPDGYANSKPEQDLDEFVKSICDCEIIFNCRTILKNDRELDIYIPSRKLAIEFNGDYWHMNPRLYDEIYYNSQSQCTAKEKWEYDKLKQEECQDLGIKLIVVWEYDWIHSQDNVKSMLIHEFTSS